jgi:hypothetical protein
MAKTYSITVRLTEEQKQFIDSKIAHIKEKVDVDVPAGLIIRKVIERAMQFHEARRAGHNRGDMTAMRHFLQRKFGNDYQQREQKIEDLLNLIEEYKASELDEHQEALK